MTRDRTDRRPFSIGDGTFKRAPRDPRWGKFEFQGQPFLRIDDVDGFLPFFMSVVSCGDRWMYAASTGGLVLGRRSPEGAVFPYETDDRLMAADGTVGSRTIAFVDRGEGVSRWEPLIRAADGQYDVRRAVWKHVLCNELWYEERNLDLGLTWRHGWSSGERFGFQRRVQLINDGASEVRIRLLDGVVSVLPACVDPGMQTGASPLVDAYKQAQLVSDAGMGLFHLGSIPIDRPIPNEALLANVVWLRGLPGADLLLSSRQLEAFRRGDAVTPEESVRGIPGAFLASVELTLAPGEQRDWVFGLDAELDGRRVTRLQQDLGSGVVLTSDLSQRLVADLDEDRECLATHIAAADGFQRTADSFEDARHLSNTLFNVMRGGTFLDEGRVDRSDFGVYLREVAPALAVRFSLEDWPARMSRTELVECAVATGDRDLERLAREYLPLTFSRRHGDPSRPWNHFAIAAYDEDGRPQLGYQGNWRDIFQNWEALLRSFPDYCESAVVKFVNATTVDGFNPYRVMRDGFEWEAPDPGDPWAHIGYWGDHQVIYLQRLLDLTERTHPGALKDLLRRPVFVYADVPYRLASYEEIQADPYETITFDSERSAAAEANAEHLGNEARLRSSSTDSDSHQYATLAEKLIVPILSKFSHYVPGVGIWLNTQRPEWNDANNALVGDGVSVVTAAYLCKHVATVRQILADAGSEPLAFDGHVAAHLRATAAALGAADVVVAHQDSTDARALLDALGRAGSDYRAAVYAEAPSRCENVDPAEIVAFLSAAEEWLAATVRANLREDGLVHAYNLMQFTDGGIEVRRLQPMLEGQVAALTSGALDAAEAVALLDALRASPLRRDDIGTYLLYPDRELPAFMARGVVPAHDLASPLIRSLLAENDGTLVRQAQDGSVRFAPHLRNAERLDEVLSALARDPRFEPLATAEADAMRELYERVFDHRSFTGRSGAFFGYEGLGCVYWHMVSKLRLAVLETWDLAWAVGSSEDVLNRLADHYADVRAGLGVGSGPAQYGAFPSDPYSHTPSFAGARQPGMTGQVKEDLIARVTELGVRMCAGQLVFVRPMVSRDQFVAEGGSARIGWPTEVEVPAGAIAFSIAGVPVILRPADELRGVLVLEDGAEQDLPDACLSVEQTAVLFERRGVVRRIEVFAPFWVRE